MTEIRGLQFHLQFSMHEKERVKENFKTMLLSVHLKIRAVDDFIDIVALKFPLHFTLRKLDWFVSSSHSFNLLRHILRQTALTVSRYSHVVKHSTKVFYWCLRNVMQSWAMKSFNLFEWWRAIMQWFLVWGEGDSIVRFEYQLPWMMSISIHRC